MGGHKLNMTNDMMTGLFLYFKETSIMEWNSLFRNKFYQSSAKTAGKVLWTGDKKI